MRGKGIGENPLAKRPAMVGRIPDGLDFPGLRGPFKQLPICKLPVEGRVAEGPVRRVLSNPRIGAQTDMVRVARPPEPRRFVDHSGTHGVQVEIPHARQQIPVGFDHGRSVAAFPKRSRAEVPVVEVPDITSAERLHHPGQRVAMGRGNEQVNMVRHQHVGVYRQAMRLRQRAEFLQIK